MPAWSTQEVGWFIGTVAYREIARGRTATGRHQRNILCGQKLCFLGPCRFLLVLTVGKAFSLPWVGPALNSFSSMHGQSPKHALRPVQGLICIPSAERAFSGPSAARIEIPRARHVEIKALLTQRRVLKGRLVYPLPPKGLKERPRLPQRTPWGASNGRGKRNMKPRAGQKTP